MYRFDVETYAVPPAYVQWGLKTSALRRDK